MKDDILRITRRICKNLIEINRLNIELRSEVERITKLNPSEIDEFLAWDGFASFDSSNGINSKCVIELEKKFLDEFYSDLRG